MVEITELNREPASTVSTLTATTEVTSPSVDATDVTSDTVSATTEVTSPSVIADALEATTSITDASGDVHTGELADKNGDDLKPDTVDFSTSITDAEGNTVTNLSDPVRVTEEASTFAESNISVLNNDTQISGGSILLNSRIAREDDNPNDTASRTSGQGIIINPNEALSEIVATVSSETDGVQDVFLANTNETILDEATNGYTSGDSVTLTASLNSGTDYYVGVYNNGNNYTRGVDNNPSFDYTGDKLDIVGGVFSCHPNDGSAASESQTNALGIKSVSVKSTSGDALISFDSGVPGDIDSWDLATFQRTLDGETVTIDVEDSNGTVLKSDISKDTDISDIATTTDVQLRANLSRNDAANNPTVDYLARRFTR